ncbi:hypothetical protein [Corynebacterium sp. TAE3-ERU2]|uniref:hypothetical protein n=1 Tax=Corynebacterium sp. TAE3-ERU2 TaxID=2849497 RepID=UPI001C43D097|nr:hypothetical protein [Corynebacterium sp. TAE3-ERU2]MBV7302686.1 hypothetical protein [Corynebacterium sp. TAE3-ERU2]
MDLAAVTTYSQKRMSLVESRLAAHSELTPSLPDVESFTRWVNLAAPRWQYTNGVPNALYNKLDKRTKPANYELGDIICLDETNSDYPWKAGFISLIFPFPVSALPAQKNDEDPCRSQVPGSGWHWGRYRGTSVFGSIRGEKASNHKHLGSGIKQYFGSLASMFGAEPDASHMTADAFPFLDSSPLSADELDGEELVELQEELRNARFPHVGQGVDHTPEVLNYVRTFDHGSPSTSWTLREATNPGERKKALELTDDPHGYIELRALEFLHFNKLKDSSPSRDDDGPESVPRAFLVCHLQCTNLTHTGLALVSKMLTRPRDGITIRNDDEPGVIIGPYVSKRDTTRQYIDPVSGETKEGHAHGFLRDLFSIATSTMDCYFPAINGEAEQRLPVSLSSGGYIQSTSSTGTTSKVRFYESIMPFRIISLIPNDCVAEETAYSEYCIEDKNISIPEGYTYPEVWCEAWAESIINSQDRFSDELNTLDSSAEQHHEVNSFANWCFRSSSTCLVGIKRQSDLDHDLFFAGLSQTRFVDICLLAMRQYLGLVRFHNRMENGIYDFRSVRTSDTGLSSMAVDADSLSEATDHFDLLNLDYLRFRNKIWQRTIPKRPFATALLHLLQDRLGVSELSAEFDKEMDLRKSILQSRYDREMLRIRERDEKALRKEQERKDEAERTMQKVFGLVALLVGVIPAFEFIPLPNNESGDMTIFGLQAGASLALWIAVIFYLHRKNKENSSREDR